VLQPSRLFQEALLQDFLLKAQLLLFFYTRVDGGFRLKYPGLL
jgi:hypothetical protein